MTSPASIARNASFTSSSLIVRDTIADGVEPTGLDEVGEALEVAAHLTRSVLAALQRLLVEEEVEGRERDRGLGAGHADHHRGAALADHVVRLERGLGEADDLERVVDAAAARELPAPARPGRPALGSTKSVAPSCSAVLRFISTGSTAMIGDAPAMRAPWMHGLADTAAADDRDGRARAAPARC